MQLYCNDCIQAMSDMMGGIVKILEGILLELNLILNTLG